MKTKTKEKVQKLVPKNKPLPKKKSTVSSGGAGNAALTAMAGAARGQSNFLIGKVTAIEQLESKRRELNKQINGLYAEVKQNNFSVQAVRKVVALRRLDKEERAHLEENIGIVKEALGEQLTLWDKAAIGETREPIEDKPKANRLVPRDPETVALERGAAGSLGAVQGVKVEASPVH